MLTFSLPSEELLANYGTNWQHKIPYGHHAPPKRNLQQLRQTGMCLDNIQSKRSSIPHAGRGAFATRDIVKGSLIAPAPLLVIPDKQALTTRRRRRMEDATNDNDKAYYEGQQLLLNYCFGHANSSLLFYPYSPVVNYINHDSHNYNAELQWSSSTLFNKDWLDTSLDEIKTMSLQQTGLLLEIVATQDIKKGQEILLDYGNEWETAWKQHQQEWKPFSSNQNYKYPFDLEQAKDYLLDKDDNDDSLPFNIQMACNYHYGERANESNKGPSVSWKQTRLSMMTIRPCRVIAARDDNNNMLFTAEMFNHPTITNDVIPEMPHIVTDIPQHAIVWKEKPHASDQHLENAFRHVMGIPSSIFPTHWMDLVE